MKKFKLKLEEKKDILALTIFILVFFCIGYYIIFMGPQLNRLRSLMPQVTRIKNEVSTARQDIARIDELRKNVANLKEKVEYYQNRLPREKEIPALLENLSQIANESNVKLLGIEPRELSKSQEGSAVYQEVPIIINAECGYHQLGLFINKLETAARFMKVTDIKISESTKSPDIHDVKLLVSTFVLAED